MTTWLHFALSSLGVVGAGLFIGRFSGELGERLKLGRVWAGTVLISLATTLPELVSTITVTRRGEPGLAVGNIVGSVTYNLFILVLVDFLNPKPIYPKLSLNHLATGVLGCALLGVLIAGAALPLAGIGGPDGWGIGHVGAISLALGGLYLLGQYGLFQLAKGSYTPAEPEMKTSTPMDRWSTRGIAGVYAALAGVIILSAHNLGVSVEHLAERYRLGATFAGATLLGVVTSLPEMTNALTCARRREHDLAVGNILGANALVFMALVLADAFTPQARLFGSLTRTEALSSITLAAAAVVMQSVVLLALAVRSAHRVWRFSIASLLLVVLYALSLAAAYRISSSALG